MTYKVIFDQKEYTDMFGYHEAWQKEFDIPYERGDTVWYCYKKNKKYVVSERIVTGVWATSMAGVILDGDDHITEDEFDRIFRDRNEAIDWCLKQNQRSKIKVYHRTRWFG